MARKIMSNALEQEPVVTKNLALQHGLTEEEYEKMLEILGRSPSYTEAGNLQRYVERALQL